MITHALIFVRHPPERSMPVTEPCIRLAAQLTTYWQEGDIEAVVLRLADLRDDGRCRCQDLEDVVTALLMMRDKPASQIEMIARTMETA